MTLVTLLRLSVPVVYIWHQLVTLGYISNYYVISTDHPKMRQLSRRSDPARLPVITEVSVRTRIDGMRERNLAVVAP